MKGHPASPEFPPKKPYRVRQAWVAYGRRVVGSRGFFDSLAEAQAYHPYWRSERETWIEHFDGIRWVPVEGSVSVSDSSDQNLAVEVKPRYIRLPMTLDEAVRAMEKMACSVDGCHEPAVFIRPGENGRTLLGLCEKHRIITLAVMCNWLMDGVLWRDGIGDRAAKTSGAIAREAVGAGEHVLTFEFPNGQAFDVTVTEVTKR